MTLPTLVVVSGPAGTGKTTLAHELARAVGCPAICRDEIKEGMVHATPGFVPSPGDPLTRRTLTTFFEVLELLLRTGVTIVAEAAFQHKVWHPRLSPLTGLAELRIVHCTVDAAVARNRVRRRLAEQPNRAAHADRALLHEPNDRLLSPDSFDPISMPVPAITVDTTDGYRPVLAEVVEFIDRR